MVSCSPTITGRSCYRSRLGPIRMPSSARSSRSEPSACSSAACSMRSSRPREGELRRLTHSSIRPCSPNTLARRGPPRGPVGVEQQRLAGVQLGLAFAMSIGSSTPSSVPGAADWRGLSVRVDQQRRRVPGERDRQPRVLRDAGASVTRQTVHRSAPGGWRRSARCSVASISRATGRPSRRRAACGAPAPSRRPRGDPCRRRRRSRASSARRRSSNTS